ncbi:MAG TPA: aldolase/citrate lyase family protein, partial [Roseimicrobium sp.]|nr:aldolase/citrate lyase family protein [Roseimicrobium sp.]
MSTPSEKESIIRLGTWLSIGSPVIAELASECGFDWLLIDLEHGCATDAALMPQLQASRGIRIVRVGAPHPDLVSRALDWGADGIMFPHVSTVEAARQCVDTAHYPPHG